jgi:hypothetical protein
MNRFAALLLFAVVVAAVAGAPAPRPRPTVPWVTGWDKPIGDCRFDRRGEKLSITVPGKGLNDQFTRGRLLRDVEGDFAVQVRLGNIGLAAGRNDSRSAGLLMVDGENGSSVMLQRAVYADPGIVVEGWIRGGGRGCGIRYDGAGEGSSAYLRLVRTGGRIQLAFSSDGEEWEPLGAPQDVKLSHKVKVGVVAGSSAPGPFKAVFDDFKLTPLGGKAR